MASLGYEQFDPLFEPCPATVPGYLVLLNLHTDAPAIVEQVRSAVEAAGRDADRLIMSMLSNQNWRVQLVGATAALIAQSQSSVEALWSALDRPCWTSPQLAAVASRMDRDFLAHARPRLESGCQMQADGMAEMSMLERHSAQGPQSLLGHSAKLAAALAALCASEGAADPWITGLLSRPDLKSVIEADVDDAASIALDWRDQMDRLIANRD
ncbi:hypothetical protein U1839_19620 [Sphingomonas sp. RT2P30]|uniref:hypothetical protein n=1 Tax=Parasphingomonas halimpatiens TaxID=3096162 RepID=UPI002FC6B278